LAVIQEFGQNTYRDYIWRSDFGYVVICHDWYLTHFEVGILDEVYAGSYYGSGVDGIKVKARLKSAYTVPMNFHQWCERICFISMMDKALIMGPKGVVRRPVKRESRWMDSFWLEIC
jgi:hypothetical protein